MTETEAAPAIAVVVATRGPSLALARLLRSLASARHVERAELVLGLNGAGETEPVRRLAARFVPAARISVVAFERALPGLARNRLVALASAPLLLFLDDDVEVPAGLLDAVAAAFAEPDVVAAGGPNLTPADAPPFEVLVGRVLGSPLGSGPVWRRYRAAPPRPGSGRNLTLCNLAVRRDAFSVTGFDGELACAEENELLGQLARRGGRFLYSPELAVDHHRRETMRRYVRQTVKYGYGRGQVLVRRPSLRQLAFLAPALMLAAAPVLAAVGLAPVVAAGVLTYLAVVAAASLALGGRRAPAALAILVSTHVAYAVGTVWGAVAELAARLPRGRGRPAPGFGRDTAATLLSLVAAVGLGTAASILVARVVGPSGRGTFELGRTVTLLVGLPAGLALGRASVFLRQRREIDAETAFGAVLLAVATGLLAGVLTGLALAAGSWSSLDGTQVVLVAASVPPIAFFLQAHSALRGIGEDAWFRRLIALRDAPFLALLVALLALGGRTTAVLAAWTAGWLILAVAVGAIVLRACGRPRLRRGRLRRLLAFGAPQALLFLVLAGQLRIDVAIVQVYRGAHDVGVYAAAVGLASMLTYAGIAGSLSLFPRTAAAAAHDETGGAARTARAVRVLVAVTLAGAAVLWFAGPALIRLLFGQPFAAAGEPLRALLVGATAVAVMSVLQDDLSGRGRPWLVLGIVGCAFAVTTALALALVPRFGATGAAAAGSAGSILAAAALVAAFCAVTRTSLRVCLVPTRADSRAVAALLSPLRRRPPATADA